MKNIKIEKGFVGHDYWLNMAFVDIKGIKGESGYPENSNDQEAEKVIQEWKNIAILKVIPNISFKFGYIHGRSAHYCKETFETRDGMFGGRVGDDDVRFFVIPITLDRDMKIELVEITEETDSKYKDLPLY